MSSMKFKLVNKNYKCKVINPDNGDHTFSKLNNCKNAIFLAGPCPRDNYDDDWRTEAIKILNDLNFNGIVINPTNPNYDDKDPNYLEKQTAWEVEGCYKASAIVFWIERTEEHPAYTTNIEFGQWFDKPHVYCGWTSKAIKNNYLDIRLKNIGKKRYHSLESLLKVVVDDLTKAESKKYFISDTHFSQQRTLDLSKRPFRDLQDMDFTLISNWNKMITMNDDVYFLGDFGEDFEYLNLLNFKKLHFVLGNYERQDKDKKDITNESIKKLKKYKNVEIYKDRGTCKVTLKDGREVILLHEPVDPTGESDYTNSTCIYGHIHCRTLYKVNGCDVGADGNYYKPVDEDFLIWKLNAIKYLDNNVWNLNCV